MTIISTANDLLITKEQFNEAIIKFIYRYERLPFQNEDDITVEVKNDEDELEIKTYRANKYVKAFYKTQDKMSEELLKNNVITYKMIGEILNITETIVKNTITKETANPEKRNRKLIHMFFNHDYYTELGIYADKCMDCEGCKSKHEYWVSVISCPSYKKKTEKKAKVKKEAKAKKK